MIKEERFERLSLSRIHAFAHSKQSRKPSSDWTLPSTSTSLWNTWTCKFWKKWKNFFLLIWSEKCILRKKDYGCALRTSAKWSRNPFWIMIFCQNTKIRPTIFHCKSAPNISPPKGTCWNIWRLSTERIQESSWPAEYGCRRFVGNSMNS